VTRDEILRDLLQGDPAGRTDRAPGAGKIRKPPELLNELAARRQIGQKIAFTNGCFDILHAGHVQLLLEARAQADALVVGLNSDASVRAVKGPTRPVNCLEARACVLAALHMVDYVTVFEEATPLQLIEAMRPDVLVKGGDYRRQDVVGGDIVESYGGRVHLAALRDGYSTTHLIQLLAAA
jgi:D-beta-D-heptose 7-phosphate kinase / D-beta-D-heptose 1-phosphate adenosyltransferase